ncbi:MAG: DNA primase [Desulfovibrionaceae bacterium]|nr:DNA primase [Desulfovibrionaceae bacterium]
MQDIRRVLTERLDIVTLIQRYVPLRQNGSRWVAPCPFHQETKPSFYVDPVKGRYYCFDCHASGDAIGFYAQINGLDYKEALRTLAQELGIRLVRQNPEEERREKQERLHKQALLNLAAYAAKLFAQTLHKAQPSAPCRQYIAKRGLSDEICARFGLGWAIDTWDALVTKLEQENIPLSLAIEAGLVGKSKNDRYYDRFRGRLIFPISTFPDQVIAFGGRIIEECDAPKYINSPETPIYHKGKHLYGLVQAAQAIRVKGYVLLTEGYMDVLTLHQFGHTNAVGVLGTALTPDQIQLLTKSFTSQIVLLFDGDPPGRKAALRACQMILPEGISCRVVLLPDPEDIDRLLRGENGQKHFDDLLRNAEDGLDFFAKTLSTKAPRDIVAETHAFLEKIHDPELFSLLSRRLATTLGLSEALLRDHAAHARALHNQTQPAPRIFRPKPSKLSVFEREILMFAARHPEHLDLLFDQGAQHAIQSDAAKSFWEKILDREHTEERLTTQEKKLWDTWQGALSPPVDDEREVEALLDLMNRFKQKEQKELMLETIRTNSDSSDFASDLEFLSAVAATVKMRDHPLTEGET